MNNKENQTPEINNSTIYQFQSGIKNTINKIASWVVGIGGMLVAFLVSLLSNPDGTVSVKDKFTDLWFWVIWVVVFTIVMVVWITNYRIKKAEAKKEQEYLDTLEYYKTKKDQAMPFMDIATPFCDFKNKEIFVMIEKEIVESADLNYKKYKNGEYKIKKLERYQIKILKQIKKIKIKNIRGRDLTQEIFNNKNTTFSFLPKSEKEVEIQQMVSKGFSKALMTFGFMIVGTLSFSIFGWVSALTNAFGVLTAWIASGVLAYDFVLTTLRMRYIAKADLLDEMYNTRHKYLEPKSANNEPQTVLFDKVEQTYENGTNEPKLANTEVQT